MKYPVKILLTAYLLSASMFVNAAFVEMGFSPQPMQVNGLNQFFSLDIIGLYNSDAGEVLVGGALDLNFDASILQVTNVSLNTPVDFGSNIGAIDNVAGMVDTIGFASFVGVADGAFNFATIEFESIGLGNAGLMLQNSNDLIFEWANGAGDLVRFAASDGTVQVVPLPAAVWLMISGCIGMISLARRRNY